MPLLTIGEFARASRLSPKALRLYDELGLLRPVTVDPVSGYRRYDPAQLDRARLVAWLRRLGMPLARIRTVCDLAPAAAAAEVAGYWRQVEADTEEKRELATVLVAHLSGKDKTMTDSPLAIRYAVRSDRGLVRESNKDVAFAGARVLAVADGFGGDAGGRPASAVAVDALKPLDAAAPAGDLLNVLADAVRQADTAIGELPDSAAGTTLTAMLWSGSQLALVHIGDSRAYLLRGGELFQITHDHTVVQAMVEDGSLTVDEVATHPQRSILLRALQGDPTATPDLHLRQAMAGDRYLLCSDGLHSVLSPDTIRDTLTGGADPDQTVRRLVDLANDAGGPDNIACVVADVVAAT